MNFLLASHLTRKRLSILNEAFQGARLDLGVTDQTPLSRENVAKTVLQVADGQRDPRLIRAAVVKSLKAGN